MNKTNEIKAKKEIRTRAIQKKRVSTQPNVGQGKSYFSKKNYKH